MHMHFDLSEDGGSDGDQEESESFKVNKTLLRRARGKEEGEEREGA